jgi:hypothetical protein
MATAFSAANLLAGPLQVHPMNPRYFMDDSGQAVYLTGSHNWFNLQDMSCSDPPDVFDWNGHMDFLNGHNHNFTRGWHNESAMDYGAGDCDGISPGFYVYPVHFMRTGPGNARDGKPKFDITQYNQYYFDRIRNRAIDAGNRGLHISIMFFQGWSIDSKNDPSRDPLMGHPFDPDNNINGINGDPNGDGEGKEIHTLQIPAITAVQEDYVEKKIDELNDLDHIIWEISNESHADSVSWQYHMINYIKSYEAAYKPKQHLVWINGHDIPNSDLFASPADVVSPNKFGPNYRNPPLATGDKIVVLDTDHLWGIGGDRVFVWKSFTRGYHPIFMDPIVTTSTLDPMDPRWIAIREAMGDTRTYADKLVLEDTLPSSSVCSSGYCLVNDGTQYLAYQPNAGADFNVNLVSGQYDYEWFNPETGQVGTTGTIIAPGGNYFFNNPYSGTAVLYLYFSGPRMPISYDLGNPDIPDGMGHPQPPDGTTTPVSIGGREGKMNVDPNSDYYFYFGIDYLYNGSMPEAYITIDYYDTGTGTLQLQYDSNTGSDTAAKYKDGGSVTLTGSNTWKQHTYHVTDAYFGDRQNGDADFRIFGGVSNTFYLDMVRVSDVLPPVITQHPLSVKLHKGQTAQFTVAAAGSGLEYQWQHNGGDIAGADTDTLQISNVQSSDTGNYRSVVSNNGGQVTSDQVSLTLTVTGDFDIDDDVDQEDFGHLQQCMTGKGVAQNDPHCLDARMDQDQDVDPTDFNIFNNCLAGPNIPPDPACDD